MRGIATTATVLTCTVAAAAALAALVIADSAPPRVVTETVTKVRVVQVPVPVIQPPEIQRVEVPVDRVVTETVEVPVERVVTEQVTVPDPTAYDRGYADARAEFEVTDDYLADWWEDGRDSGASRAAADLQVALTTPCPSEDSDNCYWRADLMGNGQGQSFVTVGGVVYPLDAVLAEAG